MTKFAAMAEIIIEFSDFHQIPRRYTTDPEKALRLYELENPEYKFVQTAKARLRYLSEGGHSLELFVCGFVDSISADPNEVAVIKETAHEMKILLPVGSFRE